MPTSGNSWPLMDPANSRRCNSQPHTPMHFHDMQFLLISSPAQFYEVQLSATCFRIQFYKVQFSATHSPIRCNEVQFSATGGHVIQGVRLSHRRPWPSR